MFVNRIRCRVVIITFLAQRIHVHQTIIQHLNAALVKICYFVIEIEIENQ